MIRSLARIFVLFSLLLPLAASDASAGNSFTFKVAEVQSSQSTAAGFQPKVPIPKSLPKFRKKQKVKFKIAANGTLSGPGFSMPLYIDGPDYDVYSKPPTANNPKPHVFIVYKTNGKPTSVELYFYKSKLVNTDQRVNTVYYRLK